MRKKSRVQIALNCSEDGTMNIGEKVAENRTLNGWLFCQFSWTIAEKVPCTHGRTGLREEMAALMVELSGEKKKVNNPRTLGRTGLREEQG